MRQHAHVRHDRQRHHHRARIAAAVLCDLVARAALLVEHQGGAQVEAAARRGQHHAGGGACKELHPQLLLQRTNAARERRLGQAEPPRGRTQAAVFDDGLQVLQLFELHGGGCRYRITVEILPSFSWPPCCLQ
jgi:hypothetical protein